MAEEFHAAVSPDAARPPELPRENVAGHTRKVMLLREACERLRSGRGGGPLRILDVGCGSGYAVTRFLGAPGDDVLGIDLYEPNIAYAARCYARPGLRFECRSAETLIGEHAEYDVVVLADLLEHLREPERVLLSCHRLLKSDGLLLVTVPNGFGSYELESAVMRFPLLGPALLKITEYSVAVLNKYGPLRGHWSAAVSELPADLPYNLECGHVQFFTRGKIERLLGRSGFAIVQRENLAFLSGPFTNFLLGASRAFCHWNVTVARSLPAPLASVWLLTCKRAGSDGRDAVSRAPN